jgi:hypothetical protein
LYCDVPAKFALSVIMPAQQRAMFISSSRESPIAQNRWPRWVMWRSSGAENGTELDAPAGPKRGVNVYVASRLSRTCGEVAMITRFFLWRPSDWISQSRGFAHTWRLPAGFGFLVVADADAARSPRRVES